MYHLFLHIFPGFNPLLSALGPASLVGQAGRAGPTGLACQASVPGQDLQAGLAGLSSLDWSGYFRMSG